MSRYSESVEIEMNVDRSASEAIWAHRCRENEEQAQVLENIKAMGDVALRSLFAFLFLGAVLAFFALMGGESNPCPKDGPCYAATEGGYVGGR